MAQTSRTNRHLPVTIDRAARIRAARAVAKRSQQEIADHLGVHAQTVKRMENGTVPVSDERLYAIGAYCEVPRRFMDFGFNDDETLAQMVIDAHRQVQAMRVEFTAAIDRVAQASEFGRQVAERMRPPET